MFYRLGEAGFAPKALNLIELHTEPMGPNDPVGEWKFLEGAWDHLEELGLSRWGGMFRFAAAVLKPQLNLTTGVSMATKTMRRPPPLRRLKLAYTSKNFEESLDKLSVEGFILRIIPSLSATLTTLKLRDTEHMFDTQAGPRLRVYYTPQQDHQSPLESLVNLRTLILTGDISQHLVGARLPQILKVLKRTLIVCDLCTPISHLQEQLQAFTVCEKLQTLYLREWSWDYTELSLLSHKLLRTDDVKAFIEGCRTKLVGGRSRLVMNELGVDGGLLQVAGWQSWGEVQKWILEKGSRFYWSPQDMWRVGYAVFNGRDPTFN